MSYISAESKNIALAGVSPLTPQRERGFFYVEANKKTLFANP